MPGKTPLVGWLKAYMVPELLSIPVSKQYTLYTVQSIYSIHYTLSCQYTVYIIHSPVIIQYTLYTVQSIYSIHYTLSSHQIVYIIHCPVIIQHTLYTVRGVRILVSSLSGRGENGSLCKHWGHLLA